MAEYLGTCSNRMNPAIMASNSTRKIRPNLFHTSLRAIPKAVRTGCRRLASGSRGVPSATASTRLSGSPGSSSGAISWVVPAGSSGTPRPQTACPGGTSWYLATYSVRLDTRTWLGAGSPSAAATNDGAATALLDSTVQSRKKPRMCSPSRRLNAATTRRRSGFSSWARSPAWKFAMSSCPTRARARADAMPASVNVSAVSWARSSTVTPGSALTCGPWFFSRSGRTTTTSSP